MLTFKKQYFILTVLLLLFEILIAIFIDDKIIRPYVGDFLVVILIYCFIRTFFKAPIIKTALGVLIFAYVVEILQYLNLVKVIGLQNSKLANIIIGNYFEWFDMVAYTLRIATVIFLELKGQASEKKLTVLVKKK